MVEVSINLIEMRKALKKRFSADDLCSILEQIGCRILMFNKKSGKMLIDVPWNRIDLYSQLGVEREVKIRKCGIKYAMDIIGEKAYSFKIGRQFLGEGCSFSCSVIRDAKLNSFLINEFTHFLRRINDYYCFKSRSATILMLDLNRLTAEPAVIERLPLSKLSKEIVMKSLINEYTSMYPFGEIGSIDIIKLLSEDSKVDVIIGDRDEIVAIPPFINKNYMATSNSRNLLLAVIGHSNEVVRKVITVTTLNFAERGGEIACCEVIYPHGEKIIEPKVAEKRITLNLAEVENLLGCKIESEKVIKQLSSAGFEVASQEDETVEIKIPAYRVDIEQPIDLIDELLAAIKVHEVKRKLHISIPGEKDVETAISERIRKILVGMGFQEVITHTLVGLELLTYKMNVSEDPSVIRIMNYVSKKHSCLRSWLIPCLLEFLSLNRHVRYPQKIFEIGKVIRKLHPQESLIEGTSLAIAMTGSKVGYEDVYTVLSTLSKFIKINFLVREGKHSSFIDGRFGEVLINGRVIGIIGEIHPNVLNNFKLSKPVAVLEISLSNLRNLQK